MVQIKIVGDQGYLRKKQMVIAVTGYLKKKQRVILLNRSFSSFDHKNRPKGKK